MLCICSSDMILGFISDIHEDIVSLKKALAIMEREKCDRIVCLGDIIGFSPLYYPYTLTRDANACIDLVRQNCSVAVAGNHDLFSAGLVPRNNAGINYPDNWFAIDLADRMNLTNGEIWLYESEVLPSLTSENMDYLRSLPETAAITVDQIRILVSHFIYPDVTGSLRKRVDDICDYREHFWHMRKNSYNLSFAGHMHKEGFELVNGFGYREYGFRKKKIRQTATFIGLPAVASGRNKSGASVFNTDNFEFKAIRM